MRSSPRPSRARSLHDLLRGELGFSGVHDHDALEMKGGRRDANPSRPRGSRSKRGRICCCLRFTTNRCAAPPRARTRACRGDNRPRELRRRAPRLAELEPRASGTHSGGAAQPLASLTPPDWEPRSSAFAEQRARRERRAPRRGQSGDVARGDAGTTRSPACRRDRRERHRGA